LAANFSDLPLDPLDVTWIVLRNQSTQRRHAINCQELGRSRKIRDACLNASTGARSGQLREGLGQRLDTNSRPTKLFLKKISVAECYSLGSANLDECSIAFSFEDCFVQKPILPRLAEVDFRGFVETSEASPPNLLQKTIHGLVSGPAWNHAADQFGYSRVHQGPSGVAVYQFACDFRLMRQYSKHNVA
jgi:hypothetical protein